MAWFDIGVNLTNPRLDIDDVLSRAAALGVSHIAITGTDISESLAAQAITSEFSQVRLCSTAGVHPHYAKDVEQNFTAQLANILSKPNVVAVGECGLDFHRNFSPADTQLAVFEQQLELAANLKKPVFLHERDAFSVQFELLKKYAGDLVGGVAHCFTGDKTQMQAYLSLGFYIGVTGWVCDDRRGKALQEAVRDLPLDRLCLETDAPYLMPKSLKSKCKHNEPANLPHIAQRVAQCMRADIKEVEKCSFENACQLFGLREQGQC